ncbi:nucleoside kinase [Syntrophomonas palmitatica]|uniref:nucleoside kinase n=1 Tax=Syntrophomonas palmitatica TaxID=402877 RepID=UPI0006D14433|nr:nucleoside kinase [Syntrophomonas palmitatica]
MAISSLEVPHIEVVVKGHGTYSIPAGSTAEDVAALVQDDCPHQVVAVVIENELKDLHHSLWIPTELELVDVSSEAGMRIYRRSAAFLLIKACRDLFPERKLVIKHSLSNGLFCEFLEHPCEDKDIESLESYMREMAANDMPIKKEIVSKEQARQIFTRQGQADKVKLFEFRDKDHVHICELDGFYEYFYGYMVTRTGVIDHFKLFCYPPGMILQTPEKEDPEFIKPYIHQPKLARVFQEAKKWAEMLEIPHVAALNDMIEFGDIADMIRVNEALHEKKIASIADMICSDPRIRLVLIAGPSSSGKTTFAQRLLIQLRVNGRRPVSISLDNYFVNRDRTPRDENGEYDFEALEALRLERFNQDLLGLIRGEIVEMPVYNFKSGCCEPMGIPMKVPPGEPIIIEGIHGLNDKLTSLILPEQKFKIYISALTQLNIDYTNRIPTTDSRLIRRIVRDARTRGYSAINTLKQWPSVRRGEEKNIFPYQENADVMFNSSLVYELSVLKPVAEPLLREITADYPEHMEARRLLKFLSYFRPLSTDAVPTTSIIREFVGQGCFKV